MPLEFRRGNTGGVNEKLSVLAESSAKDYLKNGWLVQHFRHRANVEFDRSVKQNANIIGVYPLADSSAYMLTETDGQAQVVRVVGETAENVKLNLPAGAPVVSGALSGDGRFLAIAFDSKETPCAVFDTTTAEQIDVEMRVASSRPNLVDEVDLVGCGGLEFVSAGGETRLVAFEELDSVDGLKKRLQITVREFDGTGFSLVGDRSVEINATMRGAERLSPRYVSAVSSESSDLKVAIGYPTLDGEGNSVLNLKTLRIDSQGRSIPLGEKQVDLLPTAMLLVGDDTLYCGFSEGSIERFGIIDLDSKEKLANLNESRISCLAIFDGERLVSGSENGLIVVWNERAGRGSNKRLNYAQNVINEIKVVQTDQRVSLITGDSGGNLLFWEPDTNKQIASARQDRNGEVLTGTIDATLDSGAVPAVAIGKENGDVLYYGPDDFLRTVPTSTIRSADGKTTYRFNIKSPFKAVDVTFDDFDAMGIVSENQEAEDYFFVLNKNGTFLHSEILEENDIFKILESSREHELVDLEAVDDRYIPLVVSNNQTEYFFTTNPKDARKLLAWQIQDSKFTAKDIELKDVGQESDSGIVRRLAISPDGQWLAVVRSVDFQFVVQVYEVLSSNTIQSLQLSLSEETGDYDVDEPAFVAFSPDSSSLAYHSHPIGVERETWVQRLRLDGGRWSSAGERQQIGTRKHGVVSWIVGEESQQFVGKDNRRFYVTVPGDPPNSSNWYTARSFRPVPNGTGFYALDNESLQIVGGDDLSAKAKSEHTFRNAKALRVFADKLVVLDQEGFHLLDDQLKYRAHLAARTNKVGLLSLANQKLAIVHEFQRSCRVYDVSGSAPRPISNEITGVDNAKLSRDGNWLVARVGDKLKFYSAGAADEYSEKTSRVLRNGGIFDWVVINGKQMLLIAEQVAGDGQWATTWTYFDPAGAQETEVKPGVFDHVLPTKLAKLVDFEMAPLTKNYLATYSADGVQLWAINERLVDDETGEARLLDEAEAGFNFTTINDVASMTFSEIRPPTGKMEDVGTRLVVLNGKESAQEMSIFLLASELPDESGDPADGNVTNSSARFKVEKIEGALDDIESREFISAEFSGDGRTLLQVDKGGVTALLSR